MTAIAYRSGYMAADRAVWQGDLIIGWHKKIIRLPDGGLFAAAGTVPDIQECVLWLRGEGPHPEPLKEADFGGLLVRPDGTVDRISYKFQIYRAIGDYHAEGRHTGFMLGAMAQGASAEEAVRLAIRYGEAAGGEVQVESIK